MTTQPEKTQDGGPAFPMQDPQAIHAYAAAKINGITDTEERDRVYIAARAEAVGGITLRDYFAAHASLDDLVAQREAIRMDQRNKHGIGILPDNWVARARYMHADAMLAAREKGEQ